MKIALSEIKPNPDNPRNISDHQFKRLKASIKDFPAMLSLTPLVIDENNVVLSGNMRLKALKELKYKEVEVIRAEDLSEEQKREFVIKANLPFGEWDWDQIANGWDLKSLERWGLDIPGLKEREPEAAEDNYQIPDEIHTDIVPGDLFHIGPHRLICGDSTKKETFLALMGEEFADMVVTDPPYNVDYEGKTKEKLTIGNDAMSDKDFYKFLFNFYTSLAAFTKPGGAWYVWHADREVINFRSAMAASGIMPKQGLIWIKNSMVMGRQDYQWKHEPCLYGWDESSGHQPCLYGWKEGAAHGWFSDRKQTTILEFDRPSSSRQHPTMKPVLLFAYQISNSSKQGEIIADGFGGSGTTMVACHQLRRKARIVEYDPKYCHVIVDRMKLLDPSLEVRKNGQIV